MSKSTDTQKSIPANQDQQPAELHQDAQTTHFGYQTVDTKEKGC